mmetsp:Transcript_1541/g.163  ORF Transcript_1541/g.163 Transcript_1541/m.163 type:complete len:89 (+) Transcript_1541:1485-1751(+)
MFICQILQLSSTNAIFENKSRMYKPLLGFTLLSIIFTSLPVIGAMIYIITEFSTGNIVWIMALDSLIVTTLVLLLSIFNILSMNTVIT